MSSHFLNDSEKRRKLREKLQFLGQMSSTETALFHQKAAEYYGVGITEMKTISVLMQEGGITAGQLAKRLNITTGAVTNLIDRLERWGAVSRKPDPHDRRKVIIVFNSQALQEDENIYESMGKVFDRLMQTYSTDQLEFLVQYYEKSIELTKMEIAKLAERKPTSTKNSPRA